MKSKILSPVIIALLSMTALVSSVRSWSPTSNSSTSDTNFLSMKDGRPHTFKTNKIERIHITKTGEIYIGIAYPFVENSATEIEISAPEIVRNVSIKFTDIIEMIKKTFITSGSKPKINPRNAQLTIMTYRYFLAGWEIN